MYFTFISACFSIICNCKLIKYNWESYKVIKLNKGINLCFRSAQLYTSNVPPLNTYITTIPQWFCLIFPFFVQNESCCRQPLPGMKVWFWKYIKTEYVYLNIIMSSSKVKKILIRSALPTYGANQKLDLGIYIMKANVNERSEIYTPTLVWILINLNRKIERC